MNETPGINVFEMIIGAILFGLGLIYLTSQFSVEKKLINIAMGEELEAPDLYQQFNDDDINQVSSAELWAVLMGYRDYPVTIDGITINVDDVSYEDYISLVKDGYYTKSYTYNASHEIDKVIYTHSGT